MIKYDSDIEQNFHLQFPFLELVNDTFFDKTFRDTENTPFKAKADFTCPITGLVIELKGYQLNNIKTKSASNNRQLNITNFKGWLTPKDLLETGFNHSLYKHSIVSKEIPNYAIVFKDDTKISSTSKNKMVKENINFMFAKDYQTLINQSLVNYIK